MSREKGWKPNGHLDLTARLSAESPSRSEWLKTQMWDKHVSATALARFMEKTERLPAGYDRERVKSFIKAWCRIRQSADPDLWLAVKHAVRAYDPTTRKNAVRKGRVALDQHRRRARLKTIKETPRVGARTLRYQMTDPPESLKPAHIGSIVDGRLDTAKRNNLAQIFKAARCLDIPLSGPLRHEWAALCTEERPSPERFNMIKLELMYLRSNTDRRILRAAAEQDLNEHLAALENQPAA